MGVSMKCGLGLALVIAFQAGAWGSNYKVTELTRDGFRSLRLTDINNVGQMLGNGTDYSGQTHAFIYRDGVFTDLPDLASQNWYTSFNGISNDAAAVGQIWSFGEWAKGVIYENGEFKAVMPEGAISSGLSGISPNGRYITGWATNADSSFYYFLQDRSSGGLYKVSTSAVSDYLRGVNDSGIVATRNWNGEGILLNPVTGSLANVGAWPGARSSSLTDVSTQGWFTGTSIDSWDAYNRPTRTTSFVGINDQRIALDVPGLSWAEGVNDAGTVVGRFESEYGAPWHAFYATVVPEPSQAVLLLTGLLFFSTVSRRRQAY